ncbi:MAG: hypothetical protein FWG89_01165 [Treponema sp.]|nr:hypothetical protein [Treponema sp.]
MEELQPADILGREILEDARKKAGRILKNAGDTITAKTAEWDEKLTAAITELEQKYLRNCALAEAEVMAALPIDKLRAKSAKIEKLLNAAAAAWYSRLDRQHVLAILYDELEQRIAVCECLDGIESIHAAIHRIEKGEAETLLQQVLPGKSLIIEEEHSDTMYPQIIIENSQVRICASINNVVDTLLSEQRAELIKSLLGDKGFSDA